MNYKNKRRIERLIAEHSATLVRFLSRRLKNRQDAEDIAQSTFMRLYTLDDPDQVENPRAFLFQVAANMSVDQLRRQTRLARYLDGERVRVDSQHHGEGLSGASPEQEAEARQRAQQIYQVIEAMPNNVRQAFLLHRNKGLSYTAIAKLMGVSVSSVEKYMLEALKQCRRALIED